MFQKDDLVQVNGARGRVVGMLKTWDGVRFQAEYAIAFETGKVRWFPQDQIAPLRASQPRPASDTVRRDVTD